MARRASSLGITPNIGDGDMRLYVQDGDRLAGAPQIWIMFKVVGDSVELLAIKFTEGQDEPEDSV